MSPSRAIDRAACMGVSPWLMVRWTGFAPDFNKTSNTLNWHSCTAARIANFPSEKHLKSDKDLHQLSYRFKNVDVWLQSSYNNKVIWFMLSLKKTDYILLWFIDKNNFV